MLKSGKRLEAALKEAGYTRQSPIHSDYTFTVMCNNGHVYTARKYNFLHGSRCRSCMQNERHDKAHAALQEVLLSEGYTIVSVTGDRATGANTLYELICPNDHHWTSAYSNLYQGIRCPACSDGMSFGEKIIFNALKKDNYHFTYQYRITDADGSYHFLDFLVQRPGQQPLVIEYDGSQHFKPTSWTKNPEAELRVRQSRDHFKNNYAYAKQWEILRIPYTRTEVKDIINDLHKKLAIVYDESYEYMTDMYDINQVADYYLTHSLHKSVVKFNLAPSTISKLFKKKYNQTKTTYLKAHPAEDLSKQRTLAVARFYLTHSIKDTIAKFGIGRTTVSNYFGSVYGTKKTLYSQEILEYAQQHTIQDTLSHYKLTTDELAKLPVNTTFKQASPV